MVALKSAESRSALSQLLVWEVENLPHRRNQRATARPLQTNTTAADGAQKKKESSPEF